MLKKSLAVLGSVLIACSTVVVAYAAGSSILRKDHPDTYVVKKGDTLWSIAAHFLKKPWLWPEIWQANPQVHNPHHIYPGDVLSLAYNGNGQPALVLKPRVIATPLGEAVAPIPLSEMQTYLVDLRVFTQRSALADAPYVVGFEENQLRGAPGQFVYVMGLHDPKPGERFAVARPTHVFTTFEGDSSRDQIAQNLDDDVGQYNGPWHRNTIGDGHFGKGHTLGYEAQIIGTVEVLRTGTHADEPVTTLLLNSTMEIRKGDRILPLDTHPYDSNYYPHAPKALPPNMRVIAFNDAMDAVGAKQVVALSAGSAQGVKNGQTYAIWQPGARIINEVESSGFDHTFSKKVTLPSEFVGHVMIFRTFDNVSYGLVMDAVGPVKLGAKLELPD